MQILQMSTLSRTAMPLQQAVQLQPSARSAPILLADRTALVLLQQASRKICADVPKGCDEQHKLQIHSPANVGEQ